MKAICYSLLFTSFLIGCKHRKKEYTLEGRLMSSCDLPAANKSLDLYQQAVTLTSNGGYLKSTTTDENGYFKVTYTPENSGNLSLRANGVILEGIPSRQHINIGTTYYNPPVVNFVVKLQVTNSYTAQDTLYYYDWNYPQNGASHWIKKIPGPFQSSIIDSVINAGYMNFPLQYNTPPFVSVNYYINDYQSNNRDAKVTVVPCSNMFSEAILKID